VLAFRRIFWKVPRLPTMRLRLVFFAPLAAMAIPFFGACSNEGEGQPCDPLAGGNPAGSNDCSSPLQCTLPPNPAITGHRCCPADLSTSTTIECSRVTGALDASAAPSEASAGDGAVSEAAASDATTASGGDGAVADGAAETGAATDASDAVAPQDASSDGLAPADAADASPD
jgi:hypothetical protein